MFRVLGTVPKRNKDPKPKKKTKEVLLAVSNNLQQPKKRKGKNNSKEKSNLYVTIMCQYKTNRNDE